MGHVKVHREGAQAPVGGQPKGRVLVEDLAVQMHANVGLHVFRAVVQHLHVNLG